MVIIIKYRVPGIGVPGIGVPRIAELLVSPELFYPSYRVELRNESN
jgi:hypothetical protein